MNTYWQQEIHPVPEMNMEDCGRITSPCHSLHEYSLVYRQRSPIDEKTVIDEQSQSAVAYENGSDKGKLSVQAGAAEEVIDLSSLENYPDTITGGSPTACSSTNCTSLNDGTTTPDVSSVPISIPNTENRLAQFSKRASLLRSLRTISSKVDSDLARAEPFNDKLRSQTKILTAQLERHDTYQDVGKEIRHAAMCLAGRRYIFREDALYQLIKRLRAHIKLQREKGKRKTTHSR
jgi:hypothetical protein